MMEAYRTPSKESQKFILANVTYEAVIDGLNGYFASEPRNDYITVKMTSDKQNFALYEAEAWADILISWLRTEHEIFYRPGLKLDQVEAARSAAKICCLRAYIKDEISKRGLWCDKESGIEDLKEHITLLEADLKKAKTEKEKLLIEDLKEHITLLEADLKKAKTEKEKLLIEVADIDERLMSSLKKDTDYVAECS